MAAKIYTNESLPVGVAAGLKGNIYVHQDRSSIGECVRRLKELAVAFNPGDFKDHVEFL